MSQAVSTQPVEPSGRIPPTARAVLVALGLVVAAVALSIVVGIAVVLPLLFSGFEATSSAVLVGSLFATQLSFAAVGFLYLRRREWSISFGTPSRRDLTWVVGGVVATVVAAIGLLALSEFLGIEPVESVLVAPVLANPALLLLLAGLSLVFIAPIEEFLFRGVVQGRLRRSLGAPAAIVIASLLFASIHLLNLVAVGVGALVMVGVIFVVGAVLGVAYERTDNLLVPVLIHGAYNTTLFVISYVSLGGF